MTTLIDLYKSILGSVGMVADNEGFVSTLLPGSDQPKPFSVDSKRLVLPTPNQLQQTDWSNRIGFHPLLQNLTGGESRVMERFRDRMNGYADFMLGMLLRDIAQLALNKEQHQDLSPEQASYLGPFSDADAKFSKLMYDLVATKRILKKNCEFIRFSVVKGRQWQGQKRSRVAVMHFPLYDSLPKENKPCKIGPFSLRIADVKMLRSMYEFLFTGIREPGHYEVGSDSKIAPSLEALMALYAKYTDVQNTAVAILEPVISTSTALFINNDWRDELAQIEKYLPEIRKIPFLEGNTPSERIAAAAAPARITETAAAPAAKTVVPTDVAPTISQSMIQQSQQSAPQEQSVQQTVQQPAAPRQFKLGQKPPVTEGNPQHQISDQAAARATGLSYQRPLAQAPSPTLPPGAYLQQQQPHPGMQPMQPMQPAMQAAPAAPQAMKVPESARIINGQLCIPLESSGVSVAPPGALISDGKVYVPLVMPGMVAPMQAAAMPGMMPGAMPGMVPGAAPGMMPGRVGMPMMAQPITDPAQVPGLTEQEILFYRTNPVMFQNYLQQLNLNSAATMQTQMVARQQQVPRYLRTAAEQAQQQQFANRGFYNR